MRQLDEAGRCASSGEPQNARNPAHSKWRVIGAFFIFGLLLAAIPDLLARPLGRPATQGLFGVLFGGLFGYFLSFPPGIGRRRSTIYFGLGTGFVMWLLAAIGIF